MTLPRLAVLPLLLACASAARALPGAQEFAQLSLEELGQINVSAASLLPASLLDAASSVSAVTQEDWQRRGARRLFDALEYQPALQVLPHIVGNQSLVIRAMVPSGSPGGVAVTWDDVPLTELLRSTTQYMTGLNLGALGQMQVIQGPGSALYGSDAYHGLVALRSPDSDTTRLSWTARSDGYGQAALQDGRSLPGALRLRLTLAADGQADQALRAPYGNPSTGAAVQRANREQAQTATLRLASDPERATSWFAGMYLHHYRIDDTNGIGLRASGGTDIGWSHTRFAMGQGGVRQAFGAARSLEVKGYYWRAENDIGSVLAAAPAPLRRDLLSTQHRSGVQAIWRDALPQWGSEYALSAGVERLAIDRVRGDLRSLSGEFLRTVDNPAQGAHRSVRNLMLEANTRWADGRWRVVYGGRLDHYSDFGSHGSPRLGLVFQPAPEYAVKLLYGQAFRAPSATELLGSPGSALPNPALQPEVIDTYELVGVLQQRQLSAQFSLFRSVSHDGIVSQLQPGSRLVQFMNIDRNKAHGASFTVRRRAGHWLLELDGSWARGHNVNSGRPFRTFPTAKLDAGVGWTLPDPAWQLFLDQRWQSKVDDVSAGAAFAPQGLPAYARTDLALHWHARPGTSWSFQIRNLANRDNLFSSPGGSRGGIPDSGITAAVGMQAVF